MQQLIKRSILPASFGQLVRGGVRAYLPPNGECSVVYVCTQAMVQCSKRYGAVKGTVHYTVVCSVQCAVCSVLCVECSVQFEVCSMQCAV